MKQPVTQASTTPLSNKQSTPMEAIKLSSIQLGIWRVLTEDEGSSFQIDPRPFIRAIRTETYPTVKRLLTEIYHLDRFFSVLFVLSKIWFGLQSTLLLYLSSRLLTLMEFTLKERDTQAVHDIALTVIVRLGCVVFAAIVKWWIAGKIYIFSQRIETHFSLILMRAKVKTDAVGDKKKSSPAKGIDAWNAFEAVVEFSKQIIMLVTELGFIVDTSRSAGPLFAFLCVLKPFLDTVSKRALWRKSFVAYTNNEPYLRMQAMAEMTTPNYRQDLSSGGLSDYIIEEYTKALKSMGNIATEWPARQYERRLSPNWSILSAVAGDLPMIYCASSIILSPGKLSLSSIAILQQSSTVLGYTLSTLSFYTFYVRECLSEVKNLYADASAESKLADGIYAYPNPDGPELVEEKLSNGMEFEFKNVTFSYPGAESTTPALDDVSISIKPGSLVVVVGKNGSGKSTVIKLLSRLYDVTSGTILVDQRPIQNYRLADLRQATANLSQDHHIYPLNLAENIGLGCPGTSFQTDVDAIKAAAEAGGAWECISNFEKGLETTLEKIQSSYGCNLERKDDDHPLKKHLESVQKTLEVSGGEKQRLVAARTFMRLNSGKVRFVAVDEPSSALDPDGEQALFHNLREARDKNGRCTMVFVTHRFGHLTKYADQIIVMKNGKVVENGKHADLLQLNGEYTNLYSIQANAFSTPVA